MGSLKFPPGATLFVDSQVLIYTVERVPRYWAILSLFWDDVLDAIVSVTISELALLECLVRLLRLGDPMMTAAFEDFFTRPGIAIVPIDRTILREAARLRADRKALRTPDSIQLATARLRGVSYFLSNDRNLRVAPGLNVLILDDFTPPVTP